VTLIIRTKRLHPNHSDLLETELTRRWGKAVARALVCLVTTGVLGCDSGSSPSGPSIAGAALLPSGPYRLEVFPVDDCLLVSGLDVTLSVTISRGASEWTVRMREPAMGNLELRLADGDTSATAVSVSGTATGVGVGTSPLAPGDVHVTFSGDPSPTVVAGGVSGTRIPGGWRAFGEATGRFSVSSSGFGDPCAFGSMRWRVLDP
jgi:hypothetical protein